MSPEVGDPRLPVRFWTKVHRSVSGCWEWQGCISTKGYARFSHESVAHYGHRVAYEALRGPIPSGLVIDHLCNNTRCVNPQHLEPVSNAENIRRGLALKPRKTHCPKGHPYEGENLKVDSRGYRNCRICCRAASLAAYRRKRARA